MEESIDLKQIERKAIKSIHEDGFMAIEFGFLIIALGLPGFPEELIPEPWNYLLGYIVMASLAVIIFILGKKYITAPRVGYIKLNIRQSPTQRKLVIFLSLNVLLSFVILILTMLGVFYSVQVEPLFIGLVIGLVAFTIPISVLAYILKITHMYIVALCGGMSFFLVELLHPVIGSPLAGYIGFALTGGIILLVGIFILYKFIRKYPLKGESTSE
jgi:hypothetical protein